MLDVIDVKIFASTSTPASVAARVKSKLLHNVVRASSELVTKPLKLPLVNILHRRPLFVMVQVVCVRALDSVLDFLARLQSQLQ